MASAGRLRCPRCNSPNVSFATGTGLSGYRKCVVCGNLWRPATENGYTASRDNDGDLGMRPRDDTNLGE
jgi:hypothetical protein